MQSTPVQKAARISAIVLAVLAVLGFIPGITADYDQLGITGNGPDAQLFGLLAISVLHNVLLLLFAALLLVSARRAGAAKVTFMALGLFNLLAALYGLINARYESETWVPAGVSDNWFHLVLGAVLFFLGLLRGPVVIGRPRSG